MDPKTSHHGKPLDKIDTVVKVEKVWKLYGQDEKRAKSSAWDESLDNLTIMKKFDCYVALANCSFEVKRGEIFCIMGLSGSGKSTLIRHLNRLIEPTRGKVEILGQNILSMDEGQLRQMRSQKIGMVFQHMALFPHMTARENITFPLRLRHKSKSYCFETSQKYLEIINLKEYGEHFPHQLSGGMKQRVGLARALALDPELLLMDEPFSALDPLIRKQLQDEFINLAKQVQKTTIFITHDPQEAFRIGHRLAIMKGGRIIQIGTPQEILNHPADEYVRNFVQNKNTEEL